MTILERYKKKLDSLSMLNKNIATYRKKEKLTHDEMANLLGIPKKRYSSYEYGIAEPSLKVAMGFAKKLGVDLDELVGSELKKNVNECCN